MKILLVGSGGREHALGLKLKASALPIHGLAVRVPGRTLRAAFHAWWIVRRATHACS